MVSDPTGNSKSHNWEKQFRHQGCGEEHCWRANSVSKEGYASGANNRHTLRDALLFRVRG